MKRLFITLMGIALLAACSAPYGEYASISEIPGVEAGDGENNYNEQTRYQGALIAEYGDMVHLLELIGQQKGEIDDDLLLQRFSDSYIYAKDGYLTESTYDSTDEEWRWALDYVGGKILGSIALNDNGTYYTRDYPSYCEPDPFEGYLYERGIYGYYSEHNDWSYDRETNTLITHNEAFGLELRAEVLYFDGRKAVMLGHIAGIASIGWSRYNNYEGGICHRLELYLIEFPEERNEFFEHYVSSEEFINLQNEYYGEIQEGDLE